MASGPTKQTIYRYDLGRENNKVVEVAMPRDAIVLHADFNPNEDCFAVWAIVVIPHTALDEDEEWEKRKFYIAGTGQRLDRNIGDDKVLSHLGTFQVPIPGFSGWFHAFEVSDDE